MSAARRSSGSATKVSRSAWLGLAAFTGAAAVLQMDGTLIVVALPSAGRALGMNAHFQGLVLAAYFIVYALMLWPGGMLVDSVGPRRVALSGLFVFGAGACAGALAGGPGVLLLSRIVQGAGAGLVSPAALAGAVSGFPAERRGTALGIWGAGSGAANLIGPLLGGGLTVLIGWRAVWWALVPLAVLSATAVHLLMPAGVHQQRPRTADVRLRSRVLAAATLVATLTFTVMIGAFFLAEQYLQVAAGYSALGAAAALIVVALLVALAAPFSGRLADARGERLPVVLGFGCAGLALLVLGIPGVPLDGLVSLLLLLPIGFGLGLLFAPTSRAALNSVPVTAHGRVSAVLSAGRLIGAAVGAGLAGLALDGAVTATNVHHALLAAAALCLLVGIPAAAGLSARVHIPELTAADCSSGVCG
jgi:MFS family permease